MNYTRHIVGPPSWPNPQRCLFCGLVICEALPQYTAGDVYQLAHAFQVNPPQNVTINDCSRHMPPPASSAVE